MPEEDCRRRSEGGGEANGTLFPDAGWGKFDAPENARYPKTVEQMEADFAVFLGDVWGEFGAPAPTSAPASAPASASRRQRQARVLARVRAGSSSDAASCGLRNWGLGGGGKGGKT